MKVSIPDSVLSTELHDEGVLLNLETGEYFGLDSVGMEMWKVLRASGDVGAARAALLELYDVAEDVLAKDLDELIAKLAARKLLVLADE
ncbi:MAG: PqqD family protein [Betaproteobacteria bacterium]|nr:PqqD family protein [Betaproteobacteria bacterium]